MLVGNGMLVSYFRSYKSDDGVLIFASGVSNSSLTDEKEFVRERELAESILKDNKDKLFIYFSSCSIEDSELKNTPYHIHKKNMEQTIKNNANNYLIFRLPSVVGKGGSKNTIINFLINKIKDNQKIELWKNATRNIIDIEDVYKIVSYIIKKRIFNNATVNIAYSENNKILDIVKSIEKIFDKKALYTVVDKGIDLKIDNNKIKKIMTELSVVQPTITQIVKKYKDQ